MPRHPGDLLAGSPLLGRRRTRVPHVGQPWNTFIEGDNLDATNPVRLVAQRVDDMGIATIVVVGTYLKNGQPGFILLAGQADPAIGDPGAGEELQDHMSCPPPRGQSAK